MATGARCEEVRCSEGATNVDDLHDNTGAICYVAHVRGACFELEMRLLLHE